MRARLKSLRLVLHNRRHPLLPLRTEENEVEDVVVVAVAEVVVVLQQYGEVVVVAVDVAVAVDVVAVDVAVAVDVVAVDVAVAVEATPASNLTNIYISLSLNKYVSVSL
jgi:hypothetical protein